MSILVRRQRAVSEWSSVSNDVFRIMPSFMQIYNHNLGNEAVFLPKYNLLIYPV